MSLNFISELIKFLIRTATRVYLFRHIESVSKDEQQR